MDEGADIFWKNVKEQIKSQNTTQEWVAKKIGVSFYTFQGWIARNTYPRVNDAVSIAICLNTSVEYLLNGKTQDYKKAINSIYSQITHIQMHLDDIKMTMKEFQ
jgi:transcriptional regulator with XRE-family HTH domain